jgi:hypothetical protein
METDVRSDEADPGNRMMEEHDYLLGARAGRHGVARALEALGATRVNTAILRQERPFTVATSGRFRDLADLANAMMKLARARGDASIDRDGCEKTFRARLEVEEDAGGDTNALAELVSDAISYKLVLTEGRFLRADGFTIEEDGAIATLGTPVTNEDGVVRVSLTWTEGWCAPSPVVTTRR